jgi:hypothetical protein
MRCVCGTLGYACLMLKTTNKIVDVKFEVFTAATKMIGIFWDVTPCGSCNNRRFGGT